MGAVVVGQVARDLVLRIDAVPDAGGWADVLERHELLGGKGANQAVGLAQLGVPVALLGVAGADDVGDAVLQQARDDGIDVDAVVRRGTTALLVDVVDADGARRLLEDVPPDALLSEDDVTRAASLLDAADTVCVQLQQPAAAALVAARLAVLGGARVVLDGAPADPSARGELLALADVVRADAREGELLAGEPVGTVDDAARAGRRLLAAGPGLVALAVPQIGDLVVWSSGQQLYRHADGPVVDTTGAGDAFVAGLVAALRDGATPSDAGGLAAAAAGSTVRRLGGRPDVRGLRA